MFPLPVNTDINKYYGDNTKIYKCLIFDCVRVGRQVGGTEEVLRPREREREREREEVKLKDNAENPERPNAIRKTWTNMYRMCLKGLLGKCSLP